MKMFSLLAMVALFLFGGGAFAQTAPKKVESKETKSVVKSTVTLSESALVAAGYQRLPAFGRTFAMPLLANRKFKPVATVVRAVLADGPVRRLLSDGPVRRVARAVLRRC